MSNSGDSEPVKRMTIGAFEADAESIMAEVVSRNKRVVLTSRGRLAFLIEPIVEGPAPEDAEQL
jgi:hypothetical protein